MLYLGGILFALGCIVAAMHHLDQTVSMLWDFVAFSVVFGGTAAVSAIILPWRDWPMLKHLAKSLFVSSASRRRDYLQHSLDFVSGAGAGGQVHIPPGK